MIYKCIYLLILLNINPLFIKASINKNPVDSLINKLGEFPDDTNKVNALIHIVYLLNEVNYDKALYYGNKAFNLATELNYNTGVSDAYFYIVKTYYNKANYKMAMATVLDKMKFDEQNNFQLNIASNFIFIGNIYYQVLDYNKALEYYKKSLNIYKKLSHQVGIGIIYTNLGNIYEAFNEPEKAEENYRLSINISTQLEDYQGLSITYNNLGNLYYRLFNDASGINYYYQAINFLRFDNSPNSSALVFNSLGNYFIWAENYDSAFYYLNKAYSIAEKYDLPYYKQSIYESLSKVYKTRNNFQKAYEYQSLYLKINDSIFNLNNSARLTLLEFQYKQEKKNIEQNLLFLKQQKRTKTIIWITAIIFIIAAAIAILYIIYQKGKIKATNLIKENIKLETALLKKQLDYRNKEIVVITMNLLERNELISIVINKLKVILQKTKKSNYTEIENIIRELRSNYHENILREFEFRFNKVHVDFYKNIKKDYDNLTPNELRLCAFLKMNMTSKDIASLTHQSVNSIEVARTRLRKKLHLNNTEDEIVTFLASY